MKLYAFLDLYLGNCKIEVYDRYNGDIVFVGSIFTINNRLLNSYNVDCFYWDKDVLKIDVYPI